MITIKSAAQIEKMRAAGALLHQVPSALRAAIAPGVTTLELDRMAERLIRDAGAIPSFKGFEGFPFSICASVDEQVVHGFATDEPLREGQLLSVDCGVILDGWQSDSAFSALVGGTGAAQAEKLIRDTEKSFWLAADKARAGNRLGDISSAVQTYAEGLGYGVIRDLCGHGIGQQMHEDPSIPNFGRPGRGVRLQPGMTLAIEPMISMGDWHVCVAENGWTISARDGSLCAHYEHTVLVTDGEPEVLSLPGACVKEMAR